MNDIEQLALRFPHGRAAALFLGRLAEGIPARLMPCGQRCDTVDSGLYVLTLLRAALPAEAEIACGDNVSLTVNALPQWRVKELERFPDYAMCIMEELPQ